MAKKKNEVAEVVAESAEIKTEAVEEKSAEVLADEARERFIMRKLATINNMADRAKAERLAARVLMNNRKG